MTGPDRGIDEQQQAERELEGRERKRMADA